MNKKPRLTIPTADPAKAFIEQAGSVPSEVAKTNAQADEGKAYKAFSLRLDPEMLQELQAIKDAQPKLRPLSIHTYILQAISEKIAKDKRKAIKPVK